jgi:dynein heavy chain, axonemal
LKANFDINDENFTLQDLLNLKVSNFQEELIDISVRAAQEDAIKQQLAQIEEQWNGVNVSMKLYKESNDLAVLAEVDEMIQLFDEGLATMNNILASRFVRPMRA